MRNKRLEYILLTLLIFILFLPFYQDKDLGLWITERMNLFWNNVVAVCGLIWMVKWLLTSVLADRKKEVDHESH